MTTKLYSVRYGVDSRHLHESVGVFPTLRQAREAYDKDLTFPFKAKQLLRLEFHHPFMPATKVVTVKEQIA